MSGQEQTPSLRVSHTDLFIENRKHRVLQLQCTFYVARQLVLTVAWQTRDLNLGM